MNLFFLAAGLGTRLKPLTDKYPKPCVPFLNVPLGLYPFRFLEPLSIGACVANTHHLPDKVQHLYRQQKFYCDIQFSHESGKILGSAGGLKKASRFFSEDETILMMNCDEVFFTERHDFLKAAYEQHVRRGNLATLITMRHPEAGQKFGAIWCDGQTVRHIGKQSSDPVLTPWHYIGLILLDKKVLDLIPENTETNIFYDILIHELSDGGVGIFPLDCRWYETGNPLDYLTATRECLKALDQDTLRFISHYDPSRLIENPTGLSLVSNAVSFDESVLAGYNVISGRADAALLARMNRIENTVIFEKEILNLAYFS